MRARNVGKLCPWGKVKQKRSSLALNR
jgi:hypothetical protein